jgi:hypothetical protein
MERERELERRREDQDKDKKVYKLRQFDSFLWFFQVQRQNINVFLLKLDTIRIVSYTGCVISPPKLRLLGIASFIKDTYNWSHYNQGRDSPNS